MKRQILVLAAGFAFLWPVCTQAVILYEVIDLGTLGGSASWANSISDAGQIVGESYKSRGSWHATLFDPTGAGNNIDLNTLIDPASGDLNDDCKVDFADFALMATNWLVDCREDPTNPASIPK